MKDSEADIAIGVLNKLIDQELEAVRAATRDGNTPFGGYAQTRHNAFLYARDEIRKALADAVEESGAGNPFLPQRDELVTQDMSLSLRRAWIEISTIISLLTSRGVALLTESMD